MKWSKYFRGKFALPAEQLVEDLSPSTAYISWLNGRGIPMMSLHGNHERVWNMLHNLLKSAME
jgi:hypothetical protein